MYNTIAELLVARNSDGAYIGPNHEVGHSFGDAMTFDSSLNWESIMDDPKFEGYKFIKLSAVVHGLMLEATQIALNPKPEKINPPIEIKDPRLSYTEPKNDVYIYWSYEGLIAQREAMDLQRHAKRVPETYGFYLYSFDPETNKTTWKSWKNYWE
jgi:hypothetical protein